MITLPFPHTCATWEDLRELHFSTPSFERAKAILEKSGMAFTAADVVALVAAMSVELNAIAIAISLNDLTEAFAPLYQISEALGDIAEKMPSEIPY